MKTLLGRPLKVKNLGPELLMEITARTMETDRCTVDQLRQIIAEIHALALQFQPTKRRKSRLVETNVHLKMLIANPGRLN